MRPLVQVRSTARARRANRRWGVAGGADGVVRTEPLASPLVQTPNDVVLVRVDRHVALRVHDGLPSDGAVARTHRRCSGGPYREVPGEGHRSGSEGTTGRPTI